MGREDRRCHFFAVPDNEQIIARLNGPAKTRVDTKILRLRIILNKAGQNHIGIPCIGEIGLPQTLNETALGKVTKIAVSAQADLQAPGARCPTREQVPLCQVAIVERAEAARYACMQRPMLAADCLQMPAIEPI